MNGNVFALAVCAAMQCAAAQAAQEVIDPEVRDTAKPPASARAGSDARLKWSAPDKGIIQNSASQSSAGRKSGTVTGSCIPMRNGSESVPKPGPNAGQKRGTARSDCEPGIAPRGDATSAQPNGARPTYTFPNGSRSYADARDGVIQKYTDLDRNGKPLEATDPRPAASGLRPDPRDAIESGKQRAKVERARREEALRQAIERTAKEKKCKNKICPVPETL